MSFYFDHLGISLILVVFITLTSVGSSQGCLVHAFHQIGGAGKNPSVVFHRHQELIYQIEFVVFFDFLTRGQVRMHFIENQHSAVPFRFGKCIGNSLVGFTDILSFDVRKGLDIAGTSSGSHAALLAFRNGYVLTDARRAMIQWSCRNVNCLVVVFEVLCH